MSKQPWTIGRHCPAALGLCLLATTALPSAGTREKQEIKDAQESVVKLADLLKTKVTTARKQAAALARTTELEHVHHVFKLRSRGGLGVGSKAEAIRPDGIEAKLIALRKRALTTTQMKKERAALQRMGDVIQAVAVVTAYYAPKGARQSKPWKDAAQTLKLAAEDFTDAARAGNPRKLKKAAENLSAACVQCHATWGR